MSYAPVLGRFFMAFRRCFFSASSRRTSSISSRRPSFRLKEEYEINVKIFQVF